MFADDYIYGFYGSASPAHSVHSVEKDENLSKNPARFISSSYTLTDMKNVKTSVDGDILTITVDLSQEVGPSSSGKTIIIGSSMGNKPIDRKHPDVRVGVNVYKKV